MSKDTNAGKDNSGNCNSGHRNTGYGNTGYGNTGYYNSGDYNSGNLNTGYYNSGYCNTGYYNSGYCNSGNRNTGYYNSGYCNTGYYNSGNCNSGWFNTDEPKMRFFNKESDMTYSEFTKKPWIYPDLKICSWVDIKDLKDPTTADRQRGGRLETLSYKDAWKEYWGRASEDDRKWFTTLPNFDAKIFEEITGIDVVVKSLSGKKVKVELDGKTYTATID